MRKLRRSGKGPKGSYAFSLAYRDAPLAPKGVGAWIGVILVLGMFGSAGLIGSLALIAGIRNLAAGTLPLASSIVAIVLGAIFTAVGFGYFYFRYVKKPLWDAQKASLHARYPGQPWMLRKDWAARRIVHSNAGLAIMLWVWNVGWWGGLALITHVNRDKILASLESSWWGYALLGLFLLIGIGVLRLAVDATWSHWRYGRTVLRLDTLPAYAGERLRGTIEARLRERPASPLKASLVCDRLKWLTHRSNGKTTSRLVVTELSRFEREIRPASIIVSRNGARIPIEFELPSGAPDYSVDDEGNGVRWTLHVGTPDAQPSAFSCTFEVPVYGRTR